jgi:hypothetical protein
MSVRRRISQALSSSSRYELSLDVLGERWINAGRRDSDVRWPLAAPGDQSFGSQQAIGSRGVASARQRPGDG